MYASILPDMAKEVKVVYDCHPKLESLFRRSIEIHTRVHGPGHPGVASGYNNLGILAADQRKYDRAEEMYRRAKKNETPEDKPSAEPKVGTASNL